MLSDRFLPTYIREAKSNLKTRLTKIKEKADKAKPPTKEITKQKIEELAETGAKVKIPKKEVKIGAIPTHDERV